MKKITVLCLLLLQSCIPYPHSVRTFPEISGVYLNYGRPVDNARIGYTESKTGDACDPAGQSVTTDQEGKFNIPAGFEYKNFATIGMVHILNRWKLCFQDKSGKKISWEDSEYGPEEAPEKLLINCDTSLKEICAYTGLK